MVINSSAMAEGDAPLIPSTEPEKDPSPPPVAKPPPQPSPQQPPALSVPSLSSTADNGGSSAKATPPTPQEKKAREIAEQAEKKYAGGEKEIE